MLRPWVDQVVAAFTGNTGKAQHASATKTHPITIEISGPNSSVTPKYCLSAPGDDPYQIAAAKDGRAETTSARDASVARLLTSRSRQSAGNSMRSRCAH